MEAIGFYKLDNGQVLFVEKYIISAEYQLSIEEKDLYTYPIYGWYWFNSKEEAYSFFNIEIIIDESQNQLPFPSPSIYNI